MCSKDELLLAAMRAFVVTQDSRLFYLLDVYANCDGEREEELGDPLPVQKLCKKDGRRPAVLIGLRYDHQIVCRIMCIAYLSIHKHTLTYNGIR